MRPHSGIHPEHGRVPIAAARHHAQSRPGNAPSPVRPSHNETGDPSLEPIDSLQLLRLAEVVLTKSVDDLRALIEVNPDLVREWLSDFHRERVKAEKVARQWQAAEAALAILMRGPGSERKSSDG